MNLAQTYSISYHRRYGIERVCKVWHVNRSSVYYALSREPHKGRGKAPEHSDAVVLKEIRRVIKQSSEKGFHGEGYRKVHHRLRVRASKERVRRLMAANDMLCPQREQKLCGPKNHDGTIIPSQPNKIWGTDMTGSWTTNDGKGHVCALINHFTGECLGVHASKKANQFEAMEPLNQAVSKIFDGQGNGAAQGLLLRRTRKSVHEQGLQQAGQALWNDKLTMLRSNS